MKNALFYRRKNELLILIISILSYFASAIEQHEYVNIKEKEEELSQLSTSPQVYKLDENAMQATNTELTTVNTDKAHNLKIDAIDISCQSLNNCHECYGSTWGCHWCESDAKCHAKGSLLGCVVGSSCSSSTNDSDGSNSNETPESNDSETARDGTIINNATEKIHKKTSHHSHQCHSHKNCSSCYENSLGCHWCGEKNACHPKASIYGCAVGSNCETQVQKNIFDDSCFSHQDCNECYESTWGCHWCFSKQECHAVGSVYGCAIGDSCAASAGTDSNITEHNDNSCYSHNTCQECTNSSWGCHWCAFDNKCHAIGSVYGCAVGTECEVHDNSCHSHDNCEECAASSLGCHWCEFDDHCHAIGSIYGCAIGVNCFSNERCKREEPEPIYYDDDENDISTGIVFLIVFLALTMSCCLSVCCCSLRFGTDIFYTSYQSLLTRSASQQSFHRVNTNYLDREPLLQEKQHQQTLIKDNDEGEAEKESIIDEKPVEQEKRSSLLSQEESGNTTMIADVSYDQTDKFADASELTTPDLQDSNCDTREQLGAVTEVELESHRPVLESLNKFNTLLKIFYICGMISIITFAYLLLYYFPVVPEAELCATEIEWTTIIEGLLEFKFDASFQMLTSVYNPNHVDISTGSGGVSGDIFYQNTHIGSYNAPPTILKANSINDVIITNHCQPDKVTAAKIATDYYEGNLVFEVSVQTSLELLPFLAGIPYSFHEEGIVIHANDSDDKNDNNKNHNTTDKNNNSNKKKKKKKHVTHKLCHCKV